MLTIWGRNNSINVQKVMWTVGELGLPHDRIDAGGPFGGLDSAEYGAMNPNRMIPVLKDGEVALFESHAIVRYLAARYGAGSLWPEEPVKRARADIWMEWYYTVQAQLGVIFWQTIRTPEASRDMAAVEVATAKIAAVWPILDAWLGDRPFIAGERLTMADIPLGCAWYRYANLPVDRPNLPNISLWFQSLKARDAYRRHVMIPVT